ncbi:toxin Cry1Ac domain D-VI-related protein [Listeria newyorkensis]|uniref:Bacterial Ig domain-containing protein n=1 Tax=Listeria newyorkensis TaxID=1497681 RepID=A0A841YWI0_9LIST|nr:toxin Cry1Ac domain D-VI-related protein [Listeria newyorkensis]MBC1457864.1 hypothetical protein [Listeria newyorkensis]
MKKQHMKKLVSTLTVASILGTSIVTPFNVLAETPVKAAVSATAPKYVAPPTQNPGFVDSPGPFLKMVKFDGEYITLDLVGCAKGYGVRVILPDGTSRTFTSHYAIGVHEEVKIDVRSQNLRSPSSSFSTQGLYPSGLVYPSSYHSWKTAPYMGYQYDTAFGQKVYNLFQDSSLTTIGSGVTQAEIDAARAAAANAPASPEKDKLVNLTTKAQTELTNNIAAKNTAARDAVNALFTNNTPTSNAIKPTTTQSTIDAAKALANEVTDATQKAAMLADIQKAQDLLNTRTQQQADNAAADQLVKALYLNDNPATDAIKSTTNQSAINRAQDAVNKIADATTKAALQKQVDRAQSLLDTRLADQTQQAGANNAVNQLFLDNTPTSDAIKVSTNQAAIDSAQTEINKIKDPALKAEPQKNLDRAQELLNQRNEAATQAEKAKQDAAKQAVDELFTDNTPTSGTIKSTTDQKAIDAAQNLVDAITDPAVKAERQADLDKAQNLLDTKNAAIQAETNRQIAAEKAVDELFTDNKPTSGTIKPTTDQKAIDAAQNLVDAITDPAVKAERQADLDKAQNLLDTKNAAIQAETNRQIAAKQAVDELFKDNKPATDTIKETTTQKVIDDAQKLINTVTDTAKKEALQTNLDRAQELLNTKNVTAGTITPNEFTIGTDKFITGSYTGDVAKVSLVRGFDEYTGATVKNGEFSFYTVGKSIKKTDQIYVVAYDKNGKELSRELVKLIVVTEGKITPVEMTIPGDNNITGTYTGDVARIEVSVNDGAFKKGGTVANGSFKFYSYGLVTKASDKVVVKAYDNTDKLLDTKTVNIKTTIPTSGTVTVADYKLGTSNITGKFTGDVKSMKVTVGTTVYSGGTINSDGTFKFYILGKIAFTTDPVSIAVYDKTGKLLDSQVITVLPK